LGYLSKDFGVYPRGSVYDMLDHMAVLKGVTGVSERRATVESLFQQVNLSGVRRKAVTGFSGGMRQRFGIAPIALGYRRSEVVKDGRRTVQFKSEAPILYFSSMQSATYAVKHTK
jgi:ABC-2 type transport system ATP-binding protein